MFATEGDDTLVVSADGIVAADGIHSVRAASDTRQKGPPRWNGSLLWRGVSEVEPALLDGRTMVWAGHRDQKFVAYPIADLPDGRQALNFIAELRRPRVPARRGGGLEPNRRAHGFPARFPGLGVRLARRPPRSSGRRRGPTSSRWSTATRWLVGPSAARLCSGMPPIRCTRSAQMGRRRRSSTRPRPRWLPARRRQCGSRIRAL